MSDKPETTVKALLERSKQNAREIADLAESYLDLIQGEAPPISIGAFYRTFNGSLVYVTRRKGKCQCPICTGQLPSFGGAALLAIFTGMPSAPEPDPEPAHVEDEVTAENPEFIVVVLKGGHSVKGMRGEEPGETYLINDRGDLVLSDLEEQERKTFASRNHVILAGMMLKARVQVVINELVEDRKRDAQ